MSAQLQDIIRDLAGMYGKVLDEGSLALYYSALKHYPITLVHKGISDCLATEKFFPAPAAIMQAITLERQRNPPQPDKACPECSGTGFTRMFLRRNPEAMQKGGYRPGMPTGEMIAKGMLVVASEKEANQPGVYSYAKKCQAC